MAKGWKGHKRKRGAFRYKCFNSLDGITSHKQLFFFSCNINNFALIVFPFCWFQQSQILDLFLVTYVEILLQGAHLQR